MFTLDLAPNYAQRLKRYTEALAAEISNTSADSYSDYWKEHSGYINLTIDGDKAVLDGRSGNYIPNPAHSFKHRLARRVRRAYKSSVVWADQRAGVSTSSWASTSVTFDMAYDLVMRRHPYIDYDDNPLRLNPLRLAPLFKSSKELRKHWFLRDRFFPNPSIYFTAYLHAVFGHYRPEQATRYLEIGAGNGNLTSFFMHYNKMRAVVVDLPESLLISSCFLGSIFPQIRILLPHEFDASMVAKIDQYDLVLMTPAQAELLPSDFFDLCVNVDSMQEMTHKEVDRYFELVQRVARQGATWGNVNRVEKVLSNSAPPTRSFEFPYREQNRVLCSEVDRFIRLVQSDSSIIHVEEIIK